VQSAVLNGKRRPQLQVSHQDIVSGATLTLQMGARPYRGSWGVHKDGRN
jgi:putative alpha-1,2-mannosidase